MIKGVDEELYLLAKFRHDVLNMLRPWVDTRGYFSSQAQGYPGNSFRLMFWDLF